MKILVAIARVLVGVLFIFSGLVKADDPLGLSYKMQEFFEVWNFHFLDHLTLAFSILMIVFEIIAGVALLLGWRIRLFSWLLLVLIVFFTFLTGYAFLSGKVRECGCFGDCIPLTAGQSFAKDIILLVLVLFLFRCRNMIRPVLPGAGATAIITGATIFAFIFQWYVLVHLPVVDCLPYKPGTNIPQAMRPPPGAVQDSTVITLVYERGGKKIEFDATHFPADFNDSYHFVTRYDRLVRKGNAEAAIKDFHLTTGPGADTTDAVLGARGFKLFIFMKEAQDFHPSWNKELSVILAMARAKAIPVCFITAGYEDMMEWVRRQGLAGEVTVLKCDAIAIKTAARANPTLFLLKGGTILHKWSYADFDRAIPAVNELPSQ
ncbi:MAG TPA: BT_3928 family protein [Puia sp.]|nr:BT_3928 family protein [Puia sp.]